MKYVILDIDNTLCDTPEYEDLDEFHRLDHKHLLPLQQVIDKIYLERWPADVQFLFITSRCQSLYFATKAWLKTNCECVHSGDINLFMRPYGNMDSSGYLKMEVLKSLSIHPKDVLLFLDDDTDVKEKLESKGFSVTHPIQYLGRRN